MVADHAYYFDGQNDIFSFGDILDSVLVGSGQQFSMSLWMRQDSGSGPLGVSKVLVSKYAHSGCGQGQRQFAILLDGPDVGCYFAMGLDNSSYRIAATNDAPLSPDATWHHVVLTYDGTQNGNNGEDRILFYVDTLPRIDAIVSQNGPLPDSISEGTAPLGLGGYIDVNQSNCGLANYQGEMDDFRMYNRILSQAEVVELFLESGSSSRRAAQAANLRVYPQPAGEGHFHLNWANPASEVEVRVYDLNGTRIYQKQHQGSKAKIKIPGCPPGIYLMQVDLPEGSLRRKVMVR